MDEALGDLFSFQNQRCGSNEINSVHTYRILKRFTSFPKLRWLYRWEEGITIW
jgi:hypothetical protein